MGSPELVAIDVRAGAAGESQSGLAMLRPRLWGALHAAQGARVAAIVIHPTSNFIGHYLLKPLAERGVAALGLNTRYMGSDVVLLLERAIQDLGAGVKWLRDKGYRRVLLVGNSGGGTLVSFYQAQAEELTVDRTPAGDPLDLAPEDLPRADGVALTAAHLGRSRLMNAWIDPAVIEESDPVASDPALDMFDPANGPPYQETFIRVYRDAQLARNRRIEAWARAKLRQIRAIPEGPRDIAFVIHRTLAVRASRGSLLRHHRAAGGKFVGERGKPEFGAALHRMISSLIRDRCTCVSAAAERKSTTKSRSDTASMLLAVIALKPSSPRDHPAIRRSSFQPKRPRRAA